MYTHQDVRLFRAQFGLVKLPFWAKDVQCIAKQGIGDNFFQRLFLLSWKTMTCYRFFSFPLVDSHMESDYFCFLDQFKAGAL